MSDNEDMVEQLVLTTACGDACLIKMCVQAAPGVFQFRNQL